MKHAPVHQSSLALRRPGGIAPISGSFTPGAGKIGDAGPGYIKGRRTRSPICPMTRRRPHDPAQVSWVVRDFWLWRNAAQIRMDPLPAVRCPHRGVSNQDLESHRSSPWGR